MQKLLTLLTLALIVTGCGNDPITNAGYFDDDVDRSTTTTTNYSNDESTTSNSNNSTNSNNTTTNNYYHDSIIVVHDTLTRTVTKRVTDTTIIRDTVSLTDTITVHTVSVDTIVKTMRDVVLDTLTITVHDTVKETKMDTIKEIVTVTDTVRLLKRDTITIPLTAYHDSINNLKKTLPYYNGTANVGDTWTAHYVQGSRSRLLYLTHREDAPYTNNIGFWRLYYIGIPGVDTGMNLNGLYYMDQSKTTNMSPFENGDYVIFRESQYDSGFTKGTGGYCILLTKIDYCDREKNTGILKCNEHWNGLVQLCAAPR